MASDSIVNYAFYSKKQEEIGKDIKNEDGDFVCKSRLTLAVIEKND